MVGARGNAIDVIMQLDLLSDHGERIRISCRQLIAGGLDSGRTSGAEGRRYLDRYEV